jgi:predicted O-methyltransferase YrrM
MRKLIKSYLNRIPYIQRLILENKEFKQNSCFPPGHFYSPVVSLEEIKKHENQIWAQPPGEKVLGIELNIERQLENLKEISKYYTLLPFREQKQDDLRYYYENDFYSYSDGIVLFMMINHLKPKRIVEVGSGFSSALILDTNQLFFNGDIELFSIEPYPERLYSLISKDDIKNISILKERVQDVNIEIFKQLERNDILFIDSTHVSKTGSDVNFILFEILPILRSGVLIHFHDISYPFEYPKVWVFDGRNWNENYLLRAFLMYNNNFKIYLFTHFLHQFYGESFKCMPLSFKNIGGSLWIEKK